MGIYDWLRLKLNSNFKLYYQAITGLLFTHKVMHHIALDHITSLLSVKLMNLNFDPVYRSHLLRPSRLSQF